MAGDQLMKQSLDLAEFQQLQVLEQLHLPMSWDLQESQQQLL